MRASVLEAGPGRRCPGDGAGWSSLGIGVQETPPPHLPGQAQRRGFLSTSGVGFHSPALGGFPGPPQGGGLSSPRLPPRWRESARWSARCRVPANLGGRWTFCPAVSHPFCPSSRVRDARLGAEDAELTRETDHCPQGTLVQ